MVKIPEETDAMRSTIESLIYKNEKLCEVLGEIAVAQKTMPTDNRDCGNADDVWAEGFDAGMYSAGKIARAALGWKEQEDD